MIIPDERVEEVCRLGPVQGAELLERGRAGDLRALADWTLWAGYRQLVRLGSTQGEALFHIRAIASSVSFRPKVAL